LDYYSRDPGSRLRTYIVVTRGKEAIEFLKNDHPIERIPSEEVRELQRSGVGVSATFRDFLMMQARDGIEPVTGAVELVSPTRTVKEEEKYSLYQLSSTAVFKKYKLKGYLNDIETRSLRWIKEEVKQEILSGSLPGSGGNVGVVLNKMSSTIHTTMNGDKARVQIVLKGTGVLNEANVKLDLNQPESLTLIEDELGKLVAEQTLRTVRKAQTEWKADIFGIGLQLHLFHYRTWQKIRPKWDAIFSDADVTVTAQISLRRAGIITNSLSENEEGES
jgi:spore germination protein KC